ncbi:c-type cytochrome domain-containing protein [Parapedobacter pyrenivorans]|uniref:c-type cytochrome domain-containing protein n=1 Tax=Parapedobacter pyrenivorans TaxID=1305674 RepID=UPI003342DE6B
MENGGDVFLFLGRWHPLLVHLPIGILFVSFVIALVARRPTYSGLAPAVPFTLLIGAVAAVLASALGFLLASYGGYDARTLDFHQWFGIAVAVLSIGVWWIYRRGSGRTAGMRLLVKGRLAIFGILMVLLCVTGHYGGTLTHGKGYLTDAMPPALGGLFGVERVEEPFVIENVQEVAVYDGLIQPILARRCQTCHGATKQEGGLALHQQESLLAGGDSGDVIVSHQISESELHIRLTLPAGDEKRMPPKGRTPITSDEIALIGWWIEQGAPFEGQVADVQQPEEITTILARLEAGNAEQAMPEAPPVDPTVVQQLVSRGIKVMPVSQGSNYLMISAINAPHFSDEDAKVLIGLKDNIVQLQLGRTAITDEGMVHIGALPMLRKLHVEHTLITNEGLKALEACVQLRYLNLSSTAIGNKGIDYLKVLPELTQVYLFGTSVTRDAIAEIQQAQPALSIDTGGYVLPAS